MGAWGFDEAAGGSVGDASGRGNVGTISGATRSTAGKFGSALTFDGLNDLVTVADSASLDLTNRATLEAWVNPSALGADWRTVLLKEQPGQLVYSLYAHNDAGRPSGHLYTSGDLQLNGPSAVAGQHLVAPGDDLGRLTQRLFVNGTQVGTQGGDREPGQQRGRIALRRQQRLGGVVRRTDRRGADLRPRAVADRAPDAT